MIYNDVNATDTHEISPIAYTVETSRSEHPSLQLKRLSAAANHGPGRPTRFAMAIVIRSVDNNTTDGYLSTEFSRLLWNFPTHGGEINVEGDVLSTHSRWIEDSVVRNVPWEEIGSMSERHYSREK